MTPEAAQALRRPFDADAVGKLPKPTRRDAQKGNCSDCGGYHGLPAVHLDYVGHAAVTDRLLAVDPGWTWEPVAYSDEGLPLFDSQRNLWIKLTVCGVTRLGVGDGGSVKECIGDAIRNAAMRFGVALDLWSKEDLESVKSEDVHKATTGNQGRVPSQQHRAPQQQAAPTDLDRARQELWATWQTVSPGADMAALVDTFAAQTGGLILGEQSPDALRKFARDLETVAVVEPAPPAPAPGAEPTAQQHTPAGLASEGQLRNIGIKFSEAGVSDRDERLAIIAALIGREVDTTKELTVAEARALLEGPLHRLTTAEALRGVLAAKDDQ